MGAMNLPALVSVALLNVGCTLILDIQKDYRVGDAGSPAGGGGTSAPATAAAGGGSGGGTSSSSSATSGGGGTTSQPSSASSSASSSSTSTSGAVTCPVASMVNLGAYCMDPTEVTNEDYATWLATAPSTTEQPAACVWNTTFVPSAWPVSPAQARHPVVNVDWCDARAYCAASGKRLCGKIGGGSFSWGSSFKDAAQSEWFSACENGGVTPYPYGMASSNLVCDGRQYMTPSATIDVGSAANCHGTSGQYVKVFDLAGNAAEWEDDCSASAGPTDYCRRRGGSFNDKALTLRCDLDDVTATRAYADGMTGFRCCGG